MLKDSIVTKKIYSCWKKYVTVNYTIKAYYCENIYVNNKNVKIIFYYLFFQYKYYFLNNFQKRIFSSKHVNKKCYILAKFFLHSFNPIRFFASCATKYRKATNRESKKERNRDTINVGNDPPCARTR